MIVTVGTSIPAGTGHLPGESWPERLNARTAHDVIDRSLPGGCYTRNLPDGDNIRRHVDAVIAEFDPGILILDQPVNDLVHLDVSQIGTLNWAVHHADGAATAVGWRVLATAITPLNDGGAFQAGWWPSLEPRRQAYNSWAAAHFGPRFIDSSWALKETTTNRGDRRWFRDGLHFNRVGAALVAEAFPLEKLES